VEKHLCEEENLLQVLHLMIHFTGHTPTGCHYTNWCFTRRTGSI